MLNWPTQAARIASDCSEDTRVCKKLKRQCQMAALTASGLAGALIGSLTTSGRAEGPSVRYDGVSVSSSPRSSPLSKGNGGQSMIPAFITTI